VSREVARNARYSVAEVAANGIVLFATLTLLLRWLGTEAVGLWSLVSAFAAVGRLADLGISTAVVRFVAVARAEGGDRAPVVAETATVAVAVLYAVVLAAGAAPLAWAVGALVDGPDGAAGAALVPLACVSLWLAATSAAVLGAVVGAGRADRKSVVVVAGGVVQLAAVVVLVPRLGLEGAFLAQAAQGAATTAAGWLVLRRSVPGVGPLPARFSAAELRRMLGYALPLQVGTLAMLGFEPAVRALLAAFGDLHAVGLYEVASRLVQQARLLVIAANQILLPAFAHLAETSSGEARRLYASALDATALCAPPLLLAAAAAAWPLADIWVGPGSEAFPLYAAMLAAGWLASTLSAPAYFSALGTGRVSAAVAGHLSTSAGAAGFGALFGWWAGPAGVVAGAAAGLAAGAAVIVSLAHPRTGVRVRDAVSRRTALAAAACLPAAGASAAVYDLTAAALGPLAAAGAAAAAYAVPVAAALAAHPRVGAAARSAVLPARPAP
jgi:O-antigen/teichoic acid export membrane protein